MRLTRPGASAPTAGGRPKRSSKSLMRSRYRPRPVRPTVPVGRSASIRQAAPLRKALVREGLSRPAADMVKRRGYPGGRLPQQGTDMGIYDREYYRKSGPSFLGSIGAPGQVCKWLIGINIAVFILQLL